MSALSLLSGVKRKSGLRAVRSVVDHTGRFAGRRHSRGPIVEAKKWIAVTGKLEFVNDWEKTSSGGVFSLDWQLHTKPYDLKNPRSSRTTASGWSSGT